MKRKYILFFMSFIMILCSNSNAMSMDKIEKLKNDRVIEGRENGDLDLDGYITRAETLKIIAYGLGYEKEIKSYTALESFKDVPENHWARNIIAFSKKVRLKNGNFLTNGYPDGTFKPDEKISNAEVLNLLLKAYYNDFNQKFSSEGNWSKSIIKFAKEVGFLEETEIEKGNELALRRNAFICLENAREYKNEKNVIKNESKNHSYSSVSPSSDYGRAWNFYKLHNEKVEKPNTGKETKNKFKVVLDANGGKFENGELNKTFELKMGQDLNQAEKPIKEGFKFMGWSLVADGAVDGNILKNIQENKTVFAVWDKIKEDIQEKSYEISFDANGGQFEKTSKTKINVKEGKSCNPPVPTRTGYVFKGWSERPNGDIDNSLLDNIKDSKRIYAIWDMECIILNQDGYDGDIPFVYADRDEDIQILFKDKAEDIIAKLGSIELEHDSGTFKNPVNERIKGIAVSELKLNKNIGKLIEICLDDNEDNKTYLKIAIKEKSVDDKLKNEYCVKFDANKGKFDDNSKEKDIKTVQGKSLFFTYPEPKREGYVFLGWSSKADGNVELDLINNIQSDKTVYAVWMELKKPDMVKVIYNANGGKFKESEIYEEDVVKGQNAHNSNKPTRAGFKLIGWSLKKDGQVDNDILKNIQTSKTVYAVWEEIKEAPVQLMITLNPNGGRFNGTIGNKIIRVNKGSNMDNIEAPKKEGYKFMGWSSSMVGNKVDNDILKNIQTSKTVYAVWEEIKEAPVQLMITLNPNGGRFNGTIGNKIIRVNKGSNMDNIEAPKKEGYKFMGWSSSMVGNKVDNDILKNIQTSKTVYAVWKEIKNPQKEVFKNVIFNANGGYYESENEDDDVRRMKFIKVKYGEDAVNPPIPKRDGHKFLGWSDSNVGSVNENVLKNIRENKTVYAIWKKLK